MTHIQQLKALAALFCVHPIKYLQMLIDREYRRNIETISVKEKD